MLICQSNTLRRKEGKRFPHRTLEHETLKHYTLAYEINYKSTAQEGMPEGKKRTTTTKTNKQTTGHPCLCEELNPGPPSTILPLSFRPMYK